MELYLVYTIYGCGFIVMDVGSISNNSLDIQSLLINGANGVNRTNNRNDTTNQTAEYARKGEPMYMEEMDADEDGVVTLDEFREYCKSQGMNTRDMVKMSQMAASYRTMKAESETIDYISKLIPHNSPLKQSNNESVYAKQGDGKYNISMDSNHDKMVSYKEYMEYCQKNAGSHELKSNAKAEETENGNLKITNSGKAIEAYGKNGEPTLQSTFEEEV